MDFKLVDIDDVKFALTARGAESRKLLEAIQKVEEDKTKAIMFTPNGTELKKLNNKLRSKLAYWRKEGQISEQIKVSATEDKKLAISWIAKKRKKGDDVTA